MSWERIAGRPLDVAEHLRQLDIAWLTWGPSLAEHIADETEARSLFASIYHAGRIDASPSNAEMSAQLEATARFLGLKGDK